MKKVLVTATPPTPNGDLHIGHLSGPYLGADIHTRYLKARGVEVYYITGSDDHQSYVDLKAQQIASTPAETGERFGQTMLETLRAARIELDHYARPRQSPYHVQLVQDYVKKLYSDGYLVAKQAPSLYCDTCDMYLFEAFVHGICPHCGNASGGNACEDCGRPNDCVDLKDATCKRCGGRPGVRSFTRLYFPLSRFEQRLRDYYKSVEMNAHLRVLCEQMLADGLPDISVSHISSWGIPVPVEGFDGQTIYVWFEMAPGFLAATRELCDKVALAGGWEDFWRSDDVEIVQYFGFDNGYFFAVLFPAIYFAYDMALRPPRTFVMNEFYRLDGLKFSTSRSHAIWGRDLVGKVPADTVRFFLSYSGPETEQTNFTMRAFEETVGQHLVDGWQVWLNELATKLGNEYSGIAPSPGICTDEQGRFRQALEQFAAEAASAYEAATFSPQRVTRVLCELVRTARRFGKLQDHWNKIPDRQERKTAVALELLAVKTLAILSAPILPDFAPRLWADLGLTNEFGNGSWDEIPNWIPAGTKVAGLDRNYFPDVQNGSPERNRSESIKS